MTYDDTNMKEIYLSLGSNLGDRKQNILQAIEYLKNSLNQEVVISPFYESEALGFESDRNFLNICAKTTTNYSPIELLNLIHKIEHKIGRIRADNHEYIDRLIDIDVLFYNNAVIDSKNLTIPHPEFSNRKFVLVPLIDIAKDLIDPISKEHIKTILDQCNDTSNLILYEN